MGFIARSIFVGKFIISELKPVHLSFLYLQNKERLLQGVHEDFGSRGESCNGHSTDGKVWISMKIVQIVIKV